MGEYPYYGANGIQGYVKDYLFDGTYLLMGEDGSVINPDRSPILTWVKGKFWVNNHAHVLSERPHLALLRYVYYALQLSDISNVVRGMPPKINQANMRAIKLPVPALKVQMEIVKILDRFTELDAALEAELETRKSQYGHYRNHLFSFPETEQEVRWLPMGEVCEMSWGNTSITKASYIDSKDGFLAYSASGPDGLLPHYEFDREAIILSAIGARCGKTYFASGKWTCIKNTMYFFSRDSQVLDKYLFWYTNREEFWPRSTSAQPFISLGDVRNLKVPIPDLATQQIIVDAMDKLDALISSNSIGLPAEISARRLQYEYYRNKLLTFKELGVP